MSEENKVPDQTSPATPVSVVFDNLYCATCKTRKTDAELMKNPIDYRVDADGASIPTTERYSLFCAACQNFLGIYDPKSQHELSEMTRIREQNEKVQR